MSPCKIIIVIVSKKLFDKWTSTQRCIKYVNAKKNKKYETIKNGMCFGLKIS